MTSPVFGFRRSRRSDVLLDEYTYPFLSGTDAVYGVVYLSGTGYSVILPVRVSTTAMRSPVFSANQKRSWSSIRPRRGFEFRVGSSYHLTAPVLWSTPTIQ